MNNNAIERIEIIYTTYLENTTQNFRFTSISWIDECINSCIQVMMKRGKLDNTNLGDLVTYRMRDNEELKGTTGKNYIEVIYEKAYTQLYQYFEIFIGENLKVLNYINEGLLNSRLSNIDEIKKKNIDKKVKDIIQSKNIINVIEILEKNLDEGFGIDNEEKMKIFEISNNRNIIIHNSSIVNSVYINKCKSKKITSRYKIDECISKDLKNLFNIDTEILNSVCEKIFKIMIKKYRDE